jgi:hypothetical protein
MPAPLDAAPLAGPDIEVGVVREVAANAGGITRKKAPLKALSRTPRRGIGFLLQAVSRFTDSRGRHKVIVYFAPDSSIFAYFLAIWP